MTKHLKCQSCEQWYLQEQLHLLKGFPRFCVGCAKELADWSQTDEGKKVISEIEKERLGKLMENK